MCGHCGAVGTDIDSQLVELLFVASARRGTDATGCYSSKADGSASFVRKDSVPSGEFVKNSNLSEAIKDCRVVIGHTRAATVGSCNDNNNNHPLYGETIVLTHNGGLTGTKSVDKYKYKGQVDSEKAVALLETKGLEGLKDICGSAALVWSHHGDKTVNLWRHRNPLCVAKIGNTYYYASTKEILETIDVNKAGIQVEELEEHQLYQIILDYDGKAGTVMFGKAYWNKDFSKPIVIKPEEAFTSSAASSTANSYTANSLTIVMPAENCDAFVTKIMAAFPLIKKHEITTLPLADKVNAKIRIVALSKYIMEQVIAVLDLMKLGLQVGGFEENAGAVKK